MKTLAVLVLAALLTSCVTDEPRIPKDLPDGHYIWYRGWVFKEGGIVWVFEY